MDIAKQVELEQQELAAAPAVPSAGLQGRCHFCGAVVRDIVLVEQVGPPGFQVERYRGTDCCGGGRFKIGG